MTTWILLSVVALSALLLYLFYIFQRRFVFSPQFYPNRSLFEQHASGYRLQRLNVAQGVEIEGIVYQPDHPRLTVLFFGGKEQDSVGLIRKLSGEYPGVRWISFNYRGYGKSHGRATEKRVLRDSLMVYDWAVSHYQDVALLGFSLGSSIVSYVASKRPAKWVVLVAPFDSIRSLIHEKSSCIPKAWIWFGFETVKFVKKVASPVYIYSSLDDEIISPSHVAKLRDSVRCLATAKEFRGYKHAELLFSVALKNELEKVMSS